MRKRLSKRDPPLQDTIIKEKFAFPSYPLYPPNEDIYRQFKKEEEVDPEDITQLKTPNETEGTSNEKDFSEDPWAVIWTCPVPNWMTNRKLLEVKMKKTIIIV